MRPPGFGSALPAWMWPQLTTSVGVLHASVNTALVYEASGRRAAKKTLLNMTSRHRPSSGRLRSFHLSRHRPNLLPGVGICGGRPHAATHAHTGPSRCFFWFCSVLFCCSSGVPGHVSCSHRKVLEEAPLMTKSLRESQMKEKMEKYPKVSGK